MKSHKTSIKTLTNVVAICFGLIISAAHADFVDNFEGTTLNPFWSKSEQSGSVVFPGTTRAHSGSQSVELVTTNSALDKSVSLSHAFNAPTYGTISVWVFDTGADVSSGNYIYLYATYTNNMVARLITYDYDLGPGQGGSFYYYETGQQASATAIDRTQAWHLFSISALPGSLSMSIDGVVVYSGPGGQPFDKIFLALSAPYWRPAWKAQFDDFKFVPDPGLDVQMYAGLNLSGSIGTAYEIQYLNNIRSNNWQHLADITLTNSPYFYLDTNSTSASMRFYRAMVK